MAHIQLHDFVYDCARCHTRCDGISKGIYLFENDVSFSENYENLIIQHINSLPTFTAEKCVSEGFPDIEIKNKQGHVYRYLEVKVQQRTFMSVEKYLAASKLLPSETVALNLSDLLRYFKIQRTTGTTTVIVWVLLNRLCLVPTNSFRLFFQTSAQLEKIYDIEKAARTFRRRSGAGDIVDGIHKGVTVNFHFSLNELKEWVW